MSKINQNVEDSAKAALLGLVIRALNVGTEKPGDYCLFCGEPIVIHQFPGPRFCHPHAALAAAVYAVALGRWAKEYTQRPSIQSLLLARNFSWRRNNPAQYLPGVTSWATGYLDFQAAASDYLNEIAAVAQMLEKGEMNLIRQAFDIFARIEERPAITERLDQMTAFLDALHYQVGDR
jgi:hypothetical protein